MNEINPSSVSTVVGTYHVSGIGGSSTWFRQTRETATSSADFFAALDAAKVDSGDNGFVGKYRASAEFMSLHGWEAHTMCFPPCNDYAQKPQASCGWLSRGDWLNGGLEALNAKIPSFRSGFFYVSNHMRTREIVFVGDEESHRKAILDGHEITYFANMSDGVHELDYCWGDQKSTAFILIKNGQKIDYVAGCGDRTPYISENIEKCLTDGRLYTSDSVSDGLTEQQEYENSFMDAAKRIGVLEEYQSVCSNYSEVGRTRCAELVRKINEAMSRADADVRADADKTGILRRLLKHYRKHQNPLKSLRSENGGVWTFHRVDPTGKLPEGTVIYHGDGWWVSWVK